MSKFISVPYMQKIAEARGLFGRAKWKTLTMLQFSSYVAGRVLTVLPGFVTDFGSVPRLPFMYSLFGDVGHYSAVLHDYLCRNGYDRAVADKVYREALEAEGVGAWRRYPMYWGVRIGSLWN